MAVDDFAGRKKSDYECSIDAIGEFAADRENPFDPDTKKNPGDDDDSWICTLLPMPSVLPTVPTVAEKEKVQSHKDYHYKIRYREVPKTSTGPLSNDEWTVRRLCKERKIKSAKKSIDDRNRGQRSEIESLAFYPREQDEIRLTGLSCSDDQEILLFKEPPGAGDDSVAERSDQRYRATSSGIPSPIILQRGYLIHRSRSAFASAFRFVQGAQSRNSSAEQAPPRSEATSSPAWLVGLGDVSGASGSESNNLGIFAGIFDRISIQRQPRQASFESVDGDDVDEDAAYSWTTGTAMESVIESESACSSKTDDDIAPSEEENMLEEGVAAMMFLEDEEHVKRRRCMIPEARKDSEESFAFPHDPFLQLKF